MNKQTKAGVGAAAIGLFGLIVYSTLQQSAHKVEVCVNFRGQSHCATAAGETREAAVSTAQQIDCSLLANGRDENMACLAVAPASVRDVK